MQKPEKEKDRLLAWYLAILATVETVLAIHTVIFRCVQIGGSKCSLPYKLTQSGKEVKHGKKDNDIKHSAGSHKLLQIGGLMVTESKRGGKRDGAGRPKGIKRPYCQVSLNLPSEYAEKLRELAKRKDLSISKLLQKMIDDNWE